LGTFAVLAHAPGDFVGIQVGSNNAAPTANDVAMNTRIVHGIAATQLLYAGCEVELVTVAGGVATMIVRRYFTNKSGGNVTVREIGIYTTAGAGGLLWVFLICRDSHADVVVADTELLRVQYTITTTV
ncbi:MAG: hypothetical protein Q7V62_10100, partial [Actinomycetota bacterium]|nr:hypothetical protein [Actinomycetota bacterium]